MEESLKSVIMDAIEKWSGRDFQNEDEEEKMEFVFECLKDSFGDVFEDVFMQGYSEGYEKGLETSIDVLNTIELVDEGDEGV